jgi:hypothetical protein
MDESSCCRPVRSGRPRQRDRGPAVRRTRYLRSTSAHRRGVPGRRRRPRCAVRQRRHVSAWGTVRTRFTSGRPRNCSGPTTPRRTSCPSAYCRLPMPGTSPSILSISLRPSSRSTQQSPVPGPTARRFSPLGGNHTVALPILRLLARDHGRIAVLHFDAHLDTWDTYFGALYTRGTPFRRASEEGLLDLQQCLHVGIRGPLFASTDLEDDARLGFSVIRSDDFNSRVVGSSPTGPQR